MSRSLQGGEEPFLITTEGGGSTRKKRPSNSRWFFFAEFAEFFAEFFFSLSRSGLCNGRSYCLRADTGHERDMWIDKISREIARENARY